MKMVMALHLLAIIERNSVLIAVPSIKILVGRAILGGDNDGHGNRF